jgi:hypothetical protein
MVEIKSRGPMTIGRDMKIADNQSRISDAPPPKSDGGMVLRFIRAILKKIGVEI